MTARTIKPKGLAEIAKTAGNPPDPADQSRLDEQKHRRFLRRSKKGNSTAMTATTTETAAYADPAKPSPETKLPTGFDDPYSPYYVEPELRGHWLWTAQNEFDFVHKTNHYEEIISVPLTPEQIKDAEKEARKQLEKFGDRVPSNWEGPRYRSIDVRPSTPEGLDLLRHLHKLSRAKERKDDAERTARTAARIAREDTCGVCGQQVDRDNPFNLGASELVGVAPRTILTPHGQQGIRACGACTATAAAMTAEIVREQTDDHGRTRADVVAEWFDSLADMNGDAA